VKSRSFSLDSWTMAAVLLGLWGLLALLPQTRDAFLTEANFSRLLQQNAALVIVAVGMTMVILVRGIDLSVGAAVALTGTVAALLQIDHGMPAWVAIGAALAVGAIVGLWNGFWIARFGVPAFVVTLAGLYAYRGDALVLSSSRGLAPMGEDFAFLVGQVPPPATWAVVLGGGAIGLAMVWRGAARRVRFGLPPVPTAVLGARTVAIAALAGFLLAIFGSRGLPVPVLIAGLVVAGGAFLTARTRFGRHLYAIGGNPEAARLSGINVRRTTMSVYVIIGVLAAVAGLITAARTNGVTPGSTGTLFELDVITAVVIGGTSLFGGRGSVVGSLLGAMVFGTLANAMNLLEVSSSWQLILKGKILMGAALVDVLAKRRT
jgi:D-xylose transport system permease protein